MAVRRAKLVGDAVAASKGDRNLKLPAGHVADVGGVVYELIEADERERPAHKLDDRPQAQRGRADAKAGESRLADRRIDHALGAELVEHSLGDLVGAVVLGDFLSHQEYILIALHLLNHRGAESFSEFQSCHWYSVLKLTSRRLKLIHGDDLILMEKPAADARLQHQHRVPAHRKPEPVGNLVAIAGAQDNFKG